MQPYQKYHFPVSHCISISHASYCVAQSRHGGCYPHPYVSIYTLAGQMLPLLTLVGGRFWVLYVLGYGCLVFRSGCRVFVTVYIEGAPLAVSPNRTNMAAANEVFARALVSDFAPNLDVARCSLFYALFRYSCV